MKKITFNNKFLVLVMTIFMVTASVFAQKELTKREPKTGSTTLFTNGVYRLHGNFTMLGNTSLTRCDYNGTGDSGNNGNTYMKYVDVDNDPNTLNSSSAQLLFPNKEKTWEVIGKNADGTDKYQEVTRELNGECSEVVWAGLYWSGRAENDVETVNNEVVISEDQGKLTVNPDGSFTFVPKAGFSGRVNIPYKVTNANGVSATSMISFDIANQGHDLRPRGDYATGEKGTKIPFSLLLNDYDTSGHSFSLMNEPGKYMEMLDGFARSNGDPKFSPNSGQNVYKNGTHVGYVWVGTDGKGYFQPNNNFNTSVPFHFKYWIKDSQGNTLWSELRVMVKDNNGTNNLYLQVYDTKSRVGKTITGNLLDNDNVEGGVAKLEVNGKEVTANGTLVYGDGQTITLSKDRVWFKGPKDTDYRELTAQGTDIFYSTGKANYQDTYTGFVDVTEMVKQQGSGKYQVANLALNQGYSDGFGLYGAWTIVVVYRNDLMSFKNIAVFDGYKFVEKSNDPNNPRNIDIPVTGFETPHRGRVKMRIGTFASEGDKSIVGDKFLIERQSDKKFVKLVCPKSHINNDDSQPLDNTRPGNVYDNFFNSSVNILGDRNPALEDNTGIDITQFQLQGNENNEIITNRQTSTTFRMSTTGDTYIMNMIAMAVDAYVPELEGQDVAEVIGASTTDIKPEQEGRFTIDVYNKGMEPIINGVMYIPIPITASPMEGSWNTYLKDDVGNVRPGTLSKDGLGGKVELIEADEIPAEDFTNPYTQEVNRVGAVPVPSGKYIKWTLPTPLNNVHKNKPLASLEYRVTPTADCFILRGGKPDDNCVPNEITSLGYMRGYGEISGIPIFNQTTVDQVALKAGECPKEYVGKPAVMKITGVPDHIETQTACSNEKLTIPICQNAEIPEQVMKFAGASFNNDPKSVRYKWRLIRSGNMTNAPDGTQAITNAPTHGLETYTGPDNDIFTGTGNIPAFTPDGTGIVEYEVVPYKEVMKIVQKVVKEEVNGKLVDIIKYVEQPTICEGKAETIRFEVKPQPKLDIQMVASEAVCAGGQVTLTLPKSQKGVEYQLQKKAEGETEFTDVEGATAIGTGEYNETTGEILDSPSSELVFTVIQEKSTVYRLRAQAVGTHCKSNLPEKRIETTPLPDPTLDLNIENNTTCAGTEIIFTAGMTDKGTGTETLQYEFYINDQVVQEKSANNVYRSTTLNDKDEIKVQVWNTHGCSAMGLNTVLNINPLPLEEPFEIEDIHICLGETAYVKLLNSQSDVTYILEEEVPDGNGGVKLVEKARAHGNSDGSEVTFSGITPDHTATYEVLVQAESSLGCKRLFDHTVVINVRPTPDITYTMEDVTICSGKSGTLTLSNSEADVSYQLQKTDGTNVGSPVTGTGSTITFEVSPTVNTTYQVLATKITEYEKDGVTKKDNCPLLLTDTATVTVRPVPNITYTMEDAIICEGTSVTLTLSGSEADVSYQLQTSAGDNVGTAVVGTGNAIEFTASPTVNTTYKVVATKTTGIDNCALTLTDTATVVVSTTPTIPTIKTLTQPECGVSSGKIVITPEPKQGEYEYSIDGKKYQSSNTFNNVATGNYTLYVRNKANVKCISQSDADLVTINECADLVVSDAQTVREADDAYLVYGVKVTIPVASDVTATLRIEPNGTTATAGDDFTQGYEYQDENGAWVDVPANGEITLPKEGTEVKVRIKVIDDAITEDDENVVLRGTTTSTLITTKTDTGVGTIKDDKPTTTPDNPTPQDEDIKTSIVVDDAQTVREANDAYLVYNVKLSKEVNNDVLTVLSTSGTATKGADYKEQLQYEKDGAWVDVPVEGIKLPAEGTPVKVRVKVIDDEITEGDETVILTGTSEDTQLEENGKTDNGTGIIKDDKPTTTPDNPNPQDEDIKTSIVVSDAPTVREADDAYLVYEVKLSKEVNNDVLTVLSTSGTATKGADYKEQLQYEKDGAWVDVPAEGIKLPAEGTPVKVRVNYS